MSFLIIGFITFQSAGPNVPGLFLVWDSSSEVILRYRNELATDQHFLDKKLTLAQHLSKKMYLVSKIEKKETQISI